jgi:hypothetical protein
MLSDETSLLEITEHFLLISSGPDHLFPVKIELLHDAG